MRYPDDRGGDPRTKKQKPVNQYFDERYSPEPISGCWLWAGTYQSQGYGVANHKKVKGLAHRLSYTLHKGPIPDGMHVCHTCDNPACVNPDHLWIGTHQDNHKDKVNKGRASGGSLKGMAHNMRKLTDDSVREIRRLCSDGFTQTGVGRLFGVSQGQVWAIVTGRNWGHVK